MKKKRSIILLTLFSALGLYGCSNTPYIGENGNWWVKSSDYGVHAEGPQGSKGEQGVGVTVVSVEKTATNGNVDTYTITYSDGTSTSFTVTNGTDGSSVRVTSVDHVSTIDGVNTYKINFSDGSIKVCFFCLSCLVRNGDKCYNPS